VYCTAWHQAKQIFRHRTLTELGDIYEKGGARFQSELIADYWCQPDLQRDGDEGWSRLESGIRSGAVCMRFEGRFTADVARVPGLDKLLLSIVVQHLEEILPVRRVTLSADPEDLFLEHKRCAQELRDMLVGMALRKSQKLAELPPCDAAVIEGRFAQLVQLVGVNHRGSAAAHRILKVLRIIQDDLRRAADGADARRAAVRRAEAHASEDAADETADPEDLMGDFGYESADGEHDGAVGGAGSARDGRSSTIMEAHIRALVDQDMAYELLRILTGKRGASAPLSDLHEKIFKAWAERLLPLSEQELETQRRDFVPGGELDHRYRKALETAAAASVLEDLEGELGEEEFGFWEQMLS
jgi:hypothetical protein